MRYAFALLLVAACGRIQVEDDISTGTPDASFSNANVCGGGCPTDQLCVEFFDGTCGFAGVTCVPETVKGCEPSLQACSAECEQAYCKPTNELFGCMYRGGACNPDPRAFTCYGP